MKQDLARVSRREKTRSVLHRAALNSNTYLHIRIYVVHVYAIASRRRCWREKSYASYQEFAKFGEINRPRFDKDKAVRQNDNIAVTEYHMLAFQLERKQSVAKLPTFHKPTSNQTSKQLIRHERIVLQFVTKYLLPFRQILTQNL